MTGAHKVPERKGNFLGIITYKKVRGFPDFFVFSYEGGDSEFFNYLEYYHNV